MATHRLARYIKAWWRLLYIFASSVAVHVPCNCTKLDPCGNAGMQNRFIIMSDVSRLSEIVLSTRN